VAPGERKLRDIGRHDVGQNVFPVPIR
jgi:hypothetical protein